MSETKRIKTALVSVYHKEGLDEIITKLHEEGVEFLSTGGTRQKWQGRSLKTTGTAAQKPLLRSKAIWRKQLKLTVSWKQQRW